MILLLCLAVIALFESTFSFNFDVKNPIVYAGTVASYFGYSVILNRHWIQIGAPKSNSSNTRVKEPGAVIRCGILGPCSTFNVDPYPPPFRDKRDGGWLGGTMDLEQETGRYVVCGYRWINNRYGDYYMQGICYWSHLNDTSTERLLPLIDGGKAVIHDLAAKINVFYYAQGEAGFAAHLLRLKTGEAQLLMGAPGVYNWDGTTLLYSDGPDDSPVASKLVREKRALGYAEFSDLNVANAISTTQTAAFGLFGYSLTSGYFFNDSEIYYVSGAPRSKNLYGQILVYTFANMTEQALIVKDSRQGYQYGEYFGAAMTAGDVNGDALDDLIVGAPFYTSGKYNEGRIFVFLGSNKESLESPPSNPIIQGRGIGGQFGSCLMYLGDTDGDGFGEVAVAAPYEQDGTGTVYVFKGGASGLVGKPSQVLVGRDILSEIRGFGSSISRPIDVDENGYNDLAIGAYKSNHVILLRSKPIVTLHQALISSTSRLDHNAQEFSIKNCFWFTGENLPHVINISREIVLDEILERVYLKNTSALQDIVINEGEMACENVTVLIRSDVTNHYNPILVTITPILPTQKENLTIIYANDSKSLDKFCKNCPVFDKYKSSKGKTFELSYALGCGSDDICTTRLDLDAKFPSIGDNRYVLGSTDYLKLVAAVSNTGEKAYLTQLLVELPKGIHFWSIPSNCMEHNTSETIICGLENPIYENKQKTVTLDLDMKGVIDFQNSLTFKFTILTSSINLNGNFFTKTLKIVREADITLTGKSAQQSYTYNMEVNGRPNFTQTYQVEKFGASPIDQVTLTLLIPTHIEFNQEVANFMYLYPPEGYHAGQPVNCHSDANYLMNEDKLNDIEDARTTREINSNITEEEDSKLEFPSNRTFYINCSNTEVVCTAVRCTMGPFKHKQNVAVVQVKMLLDVEALSGVLGVRDIVIVSTDGGVVLSDEAFKQSGNRPDNARVSSIFIGEKTEEKVDLWIYMVAVAAGLLLLLLLVLGLIKAGFFQRSKKKELEALKEAEEVQQFKCETEDEGQPKSNEEEG